MADKDLPSLDLTRLARGLLEEEEGGKRERKGKMNK